jgi:lipoprotein-anchoring transpeptidase ErfK/SrfK
MGGRLVAVIALAAIAAGGSEVAAAGEPAQTLATLAHSHKVVWDLDHRGARGARVHANRPITGGTTVLPVLRRKTTKDGVRWLRVLVPGRPNGRAGWIAQQGTRLTKTNWRLTVRTGSRKVLVYHRGRRIRTFAAVVGKPSTPTPRGRFFVEESVLMPPGSAGAPYALATSARSNVLQEFEGGPGQIALHGVANLGGTPGTAVSHGCVRLANSNIAWLAARIGPGVRITITR